MKYLRHFALVGGMLFLPGCGGIIDWGKSHFDGGKQASYDKKKVAPYLRHMIVYHHFHTKAVFDVMWLSDEMKTIYSDIHARMYGKNEDAHKTFLRRQLKANSHFISFYVLASKQAPLNAKECRWKMCLTVNDKKYVPSDLRIVELSPEYELLFGKMFNKYKRAYEVKFERKDPDGKDIFPSGTQLLTLTFNSPDYYTSAVWKLTPDGAAEEEEEE